MNFWGWVCDVFALSPAEELEHHQLLVEYGIEEPTPAEQRQLEREEQEVYLSHAPYHKDVWYDGKYTGYVQWYQIDQQGRRVYLPSITSFYSGWTGDIPNEIVPIVDGEIVEEYSPVYKRLQGNNY